jgi:lysophospholipid acyltransferase (LPLAT)-like uncharacterized protein
MSADAVATAQTYSRRVVWTARLGSWIVRLIGRTWRFRVTHDAEFRQARTAGQPVIFTLWHGQLLPLLYLHRNEGIAILISEHGDGEIIARIATSLGYRTVRGSTSRGAARALLGLTRVIDEGRDVAITPDGPRGPARSFAPGTLVVAQRSGAPILPIAAAASGAWHLQSWDRFLIPRPFSRVHVAYGDFAYIETSSAREALENEARVRELLLVAEQRAHEE